jgi:hypothetical protein
MLGKGYGSQESTCTHNLYLILTYILDLNLIAILPTDNR